MAKRENERNRPAEEGNIGSDEERIRSGVEDTGGMAEDTDEEFEDTEDLEDEEEEEGEGSF